jgi:hypothetical protein
MCLAISDDGCDIRIGESITVGKVSGYIISEKPTLVCIWSTFNSPDWIIIIIPM